MCIFFFFLFRDHDGKMPVIIVNLKDIRYTLGKDLIGIILGGCYTKNNVMFQRLVNELKTINAKFVFFFKTKTLKSAIDPILLNINKYNKYLSRLQEIDKKTDLVAYVRQKCFNFKMTAPISYNLSKLCSEIGELRFTYDYPNQEMLQFMNENANVMAILTHDTDFLAFEHNCQFWNISNLDVTTLKCIRFSKEKLHNNLKLNPKQMHLLSALAGHDHIQKFDLQPFLDSLREKYPRQHKIKKLSMFIKDQSIVDNNFNLDDICTKVFGENYTDDMLNGFQNVLNYYSLKIELKTPNENDKFLKRCYAENPFAYKLTQDIIYISCLPYIYYSKLKSENYGKLILPTLMKFCGILFKDEMPRPETRTICMKTTHGQPTETIIDDIIYPSSNFVFFFIVNCGFPI